MWLFQVIYQLCANTDTSGPTMRYLRTSQDFLYSHLQHLPFLIPGEYYSTVQISIFNLYCIETIVLQQLVHLFLED